MQFFASLRNKKLHVQPFRTKGASRREVVQQQPYIRVFSHEEARQNKYTVEGIQTPPPPITLPPQKNAESEKEKNEKARDRTDLL